jgi:rhamnosyltransferase subunit B
MAKRIVLATWGSLGDLHPYLAIALRLAARGHEPVLATSQIHRAKVEREGIRFAPLGPHLDPTDSELLRRAMDPRHGPEFLVRDVLYPYTQSAVREALRAIEGADLVVTHTVAFGAQLAAEKTGIPWLSGNLAPAGFFSAYDPPVLPPYVWMGRFYALGPVTGRAMRALGRSITRRWLAPIRATRARLGLPPDRDPLFDTQFSPRGTLALFSPLLGQPQPDWPPKVTLTGFAFYDRQQPEIPPPVGLEEFLDSGDPPLVFALGSAAVFVAGDFYRHSIEAARRLGRRTLLLIGGEQVNPIPRPLPPGVGVFAYAPYSQVFPRAAAIVHQGGIGTTAAAMRAGRPMLVVPFSHDQPDNARRVTRLGIARIIPRNAYCARRAAARLEVLLSGPACRARAQEVGQLVHQENGAEAAARLIEAELAA